MDFLRWIMGTVAFRIAGFFPEKILGQCKNQQISLWNIKRDNQSMSATTYARNYKKVSHMAKESSLKTKAITKSGLPFIFIKNRKRRGIFLGVIVGIGIIVFASTRVWNITLVGAQNINPDDLLNQLSQLGVKKGVSISSINVKETEYSLMLKNPLIAWVTINILGSTAEIQVSERTIAPPKEHYVDKFANVTAICDGQIVYMEIYDGQAVVMRGDTVRRGDVIISGIMEDKSLNTRVVYAKGKVLAKTYEILEANVSLEQKVMVPTGENHQRKVLVIGEKEYPLGAKYKGTAPYSVTSNEISLMGKISIKTYYYSTLMEKTITLTPTMAKELAMKEIAEKEKMLKNCKIYSRDTVGTCQNGYFRVQCTLSVEKNIAESTEFFNNAMIK